MQYRVVEEIEAKTASGLRIIKAGQVINLLPEKAEKFVIEGRLAPIIEQAPDSTDSSIDTRVKMSKEVIVEEEKPQTLQRTVEYVLYKSHLLDGELVLVVKDEKCLRKYKPMFPGIVAYLPEEIRELKRFEGDKDAIKAIHFAKKEFEGELIRSEK